jgi:hypothetical protein
VDQRLLRWVAFRFVTAAIVVQRFGRSERRARSRLARLESAGLVVSRQVHLAAPKLYAVSGPGRRPAGSPPPPAAALGDPDHPLARDRQLELARLELTILTERDCRAAEAQGQGRYSVGCVRDGQPVRRWPDVVIEGQGRRAAVEIELAAKTTERLRAILLGYLTDPVYDRVQIRCGSRVLARRIDQLVSELSGDDDVSPTVI